MRRIFALVPWAICAWVLVSVHSSDTEIAHVGVPDAAAQSKKKKKKTPVSRCVSFSQDQTRDNAISMTLKNRCDVDLSCSVSWTLRCDGDDGKRKEREVFTLLDDSSYTTDATADVCGEDGWAISDVSWACQDLLDADE